MCECIFVFMIMPERKKNNFFIHNGSRLSYGICFWSGSVYKLSHTNFLLEITSRTCTLSAGKTSWNILHTATLNNNQMVSFFWRNIAILSDVEMLFLVWYIDIYNSIGVLLQSVRSHCCIEYENSVLLLTRVKLE